MECEAVKLAHNLALEAATAWIAEEFDDCAALMRFKADLMPAPYSGQA